MKRIIFILAVIIPCFIAQAMTVNDLIKKYRKAIPNAQYTLIKGKALKNQIDSVSTEAEKEILRTAKKLETVGGFVNDELYNNLNADLDELKGYSCVVSYTENDNEPEEVAHPIKSMINGITNPNIKVTVYGKDTSSSQCILQPVIIVNFMGMTAIAYIDGKIKPGDEKKLLHFDTETTTSIEDIDD